jgi:hypothetical protein
MFAVSIRFNQNADSSASSETVPIFETKSACDFAPSGAVVSRSRGRGVLKLACHAASHLCVGKALDETNREIREPVRAGLKFVGLAHARADRKVDAADELLKCCEFARR